MVETSNVPGGIHGGDTGASPYLFFRVDDIDAALARVRELCGVIVHHDSSDDPVSIARFGQFALCKDDPGLEFRPPPATEVAATRFPHAIAFA